MQEVSRPCAASYTVWQEQLDFEFILEHASRNCAWTTSERLKKTEWSEATEAETTSVPKRNVLLEEQLSLAASSFSEDISVQ